MRISQLQEVVDQWIKTKGVRYFNELTNTVVLMEEVGELSRHMARHYGEQSYKEAKEEKDVREMIEEEMGDVMFVLICLANQMNIDLEEVMKKNISKKTKRDGDRHNLNPKLNR